MIKNISVIGAGVMGHGIASVFAGHGYQVSLYEEYETVRDLVMDKIQSELEFMAEEGFIDPCAIESTLSNIILYDNLVNAVKDADYVIEATPENLALKQDLFATLDHICPAHTIFASNTSSIPLEDMAKHLSAERKARFMVCHWYNPAQIIPIAELSFFGNMPLDVFTQVYDLYVTSGKQPIRVLKDIPGLVANRMLHALAREVFSLVEQGVATPEDVEKALKFGPGFRSATTGILEVADMGGLDLWCSVEDRLFKELNQSDHASDYLRQKVSEGKLGIKTGEGFFRYPEETKQAASRNFQKKLMIQNKASKNY